VRHADGHAGHNEDPELDRAATVAVIVAAGESPGKPRNSPLKNSMGCVIAWMRCQNSDASRYSASRAEFSSALGEVEKCHDGHFSTGC
jgi:hypothetical protein